MTESWNQPSAVADGVLDELLPEELDWQRLVRTYPKTAIALAALGGYVLGRSRGSAVLLAVSEFAADAVTGTVNELVGQDVL